MSENPHQDPNHTHARNLTFEEVEPGTHITVRRWIHVLDYTWVGDIFHVVSVNFPFVVANRRGTFRTERMTLNLEQVEVSLLTEEFVEAAEVSPSTIGHPSPI